MTINKKVQRSTARAMASLDVMERKLIRERGGDLFRLEHAQMKALQAFLLLWPEDEKMIFIKMYAEEVLILESKYPVYRKNSVMRWLIGSVILLFALFLLLPEA